MLTTYKTDYPVAEFVDENRFVFYNENCLPLPPKKVENSLRSIVFLNQIMVMR